MVITGKPIMYTLYGTARSGSAAIEMALKACGVEYRICTASSWQKESHLEELRQINPLVQIPTLILADGSELTESAAILIYLGMEYPASGLLSQDAAVRAQQLRGLVYIAANCYASVGIIDYPERWLPDGTEDHNTQLAQGTVQKLYQQWDSFSDVFFGSKAWQPAHPGGLEMLAAVVTRWSQAREHLRLSRPGFCLSLTEAEKHPAIRDVIENHWSPERP
ncbi:glutathione S-transferase [Cronobacter condimenti]|nr:glutathione S-transferase [Cronobacter condimenti]